MRRFGVAAAVLLALWGAHPAHAEQQNKGLFVAPVREYIGVEAAKSAQKQLTVANNTASELSITFSVEQFNVSDYTYDFTFSPNKDDWVRLGATQISLSPGKSYVLDYVISPPLDATPGGHYFTVLATASSANGDANHKVQAATTVYVTVQGALAYSTNVIQASAPRILFGSDLSFSLDVKNTGNTHFFVYTSGQLEGFTSRGKGVETTHLLMPGTVRTVGSSAPSPILPGVYTVVYGYKTDAGETVQRSQHVLYLPIWSLFVAGGTVWIGVILVRRYRRRLLAPRHGRIRHS